MTVKALAVVVAMAVPSAAMAAEPAPVDRGTVLAAPCTACHGPGGRSAGSSIPSLDALTAADLQAKLSGYKAGELEGTIMNRIAKGYTDEEITQIAATLGVKQ